MDETVPQAIITNPDFDSLVQPGRLVFDNQLLPELLGTLIRCRDVPNDRDYSIFASARGEWEQPDTSVTDVFIKRFEATEEDCRVDKERFNRRVRREATVWKSINHPNILPFIGYRAVRGSPWLVTPWCQYGNLGSYIAAHRGLSDLQRLQLLCGAARGLAHLHSRTPLIVHGGLTHTNVIVQDNLEAALCDFGVGQIFIGTGITFTVKRPEDLRAGNVGGYWAKEVLQGSSLPTTASDVYTFGGLILTAMSGKNPFHNKKNDLARIAAVCMGLIPHPKDHPRLPGSDPLWGLLRECWSEEPEKRPTIHTVLQKLESEKEMRLL